MLRQRQRQRGMVERVASWATSWLSLGLIVVAVAPLVPRADLRCVGYLPECDAAIEDIRTSTPEGRQIIEALEASDHIHFIHETSDPRGTMNVALSENNAYDLESGGTGLGTSSVTRWHPTDTSVSVSDNVARDPTASLQHELYHANLADQGGWTSENIPGTDVDRDEIDATIVENAYRRANNLEPRTKYGEADVPQPPIID
jgi:hypothetical protein